MPTMSTRDAPAVAAAAAIHASQVDELRQLLTKHPELAGARLADDDPKG
jgi:hypothetical protein